MRIKLRIKVRLKLRMNVDGGESAGSKLKVLGKT